MAKRSPHEIFDVFYPEPLPGGRLALYTTTLARGNQQSHWCYNLRQADRLCQRFRNSRRIQVGVGLQSKEQALGIARQRRRRATAGSIRGCDASVTALTALWVEIRYAAKATAAFGENPLGGTPLGGTPLGGTPPGGTLPLPPGRRQALGLLAALEQRPAIVISAPVLGEKGRPGTIAGQSGQPDSAPAGAVYAFWRLRRPWVLDLRADAAVERERARRLLRRIHAAVASLAAEHGWWLGVTADRAGDLGAVFPVPGFAVGGDSRGPRATLETFPLLPGDGRYRRSDFESLPEPPAPDPQPWRDVFEPAARRSRRLYDFRTIAAGCPWIRACRAERASLSPEQMLSAVKLLRWCETPGADNARLVHEICAGHPGYDPIDTDRLLARELRSPAGPITCRQIGKAPGVFERHCSKCPHFGRIETPVEIAAQAAGERTADAVADPPPPAREVPVPGDAEGDLSPVASSEATGDSRTRILITSRQHEVNDQAVAVLAARAQLFQRGGLLVELVRTPGAPPRVHRVREARLQEVLSELCDFVIRLDTGELRSVPPPRWTTRGILARGRWPELPQLAAAAGGAPPEGRVANVSSGMSSAAACDNEDPRVNAQQLAPEIVPAVAGELLEGLEEVLTALGGAGTARQITAAVAAEPERFADLAAAFERLFPDLEPGDPALAVALGYRLRHLKRRPAGGRVLIQTRRTRDGAVWAVDRNHPDPKEEAMMIADLFDSRGPSAADQRVLERLRRHRRAFHQLDPDGEHQAAVRERLLGLLDDMEECVYEDGGAAPAVAESWQLVDELEARYWEVPASTAAPRDAEVVAIHSKPRQGKPAARDHRSDEPPISSQRAA